MSTNGQRRPPRPRIEMLGAPPPDEAAAIVAAIERFLAESSPRSGGDRLGVDAWQRAALLEGVSAKDSFSPPRPGATAWAP